MPAAQPSYPLRCLLCRQDWGDTTAVAQQVSDAKEPIYQRLTAAGITAFPGVAALVAQVREWVGSVKTTPPCCLILGVRRACQASHSGTLLRVAVGL